MAGGAAEMIGRQPRAGAGRFPYLSAHGSAGEGSASPAGQRNSAEWVNERGRGVEGEREARAKPAREFRWPFASRYRYFAPTDHPPTHAHTHTHTYSWRHMHSYANMHPHTISFRPGLEKQPCPMQKTRTGQHNPGNPSAPFPRGGKQGGKIGEGSAKCLGLEPTQS